MRICINLQPKMGNKTTEAKNFNITLDQNSTNGSICNAINIADSVFYFI